MKTIYKTLGCVLAIASSLNLTAQDENLVLNGSFENTQGSSKSVKSFKYLDSISSSNNTTVDLYSANSCRSDYEIPENHMGTMASKSGNNYVGIVAYYADDAGIFKTKPGYQKYSEYIQFTLREPLVAGKTYLFSFSASLADGSAYAVSGLGFYASNTKVDVKNNSFLELSPQVVNPFIMQGKEWGTFTGAYVAKGGERYLTLGCFENYMDVKKVIPEFTNNSRKAYYYIDDVSVVPYTIPKEDITNILIGACFRLEDLNFELDKAIILPESFGELDDLANFLKTYPYVDVYIDGHTDKTGTDEHNQTLSEERAAAVKKYLTDKDVDDTRLKARGFGESQPVDLSSENSLINRRVEITICDLDGK